MKVFHHSDADGKGAAYWVSKKFNLTDPKDFIMVDYGRETDFSVIDKDEVVYIVDFSFEPDVLRKEILSRTKNVVWIDHHQSAIAKYENFDQAIKGIRISGVSGCELTWWYLFDDGVNKEPNLKKIKEDVHKAPWFTKYIGDYDVWEYKYKDETEYFSLGFAALGEMQPLDKEWDKLHDIEEVRMIISSGEIIKAYRESLAERMLENGFEYNIDGHTIFCLNNILGGSKWFLDEINKYDAVCAFHYMGNGLWEYSLYSEKIDTTTLDFYKGRHTEGHAGASGIEIDRFIFGK